MPDRPPDEISITTHRCDLCADPNCTQMWVTRFTNNIIWPASAIDQKTGKFGPTEFSNKEEWGICIPCRELIDQFSSKSAAALVDRLKEFYSLNSSSPVRDYMRRRVLHLAVILSVEPHGPWDLREVPTGPATNQLWHRQ